MSTFPNKPSDTETARASAPPAGTGRTPHAFMVEAFGVKTRLLEHRRAFLTAALAAERRAFDDGRGYAAVDVDAYFEALAAETAAAHPRLQTWRR